MNAKPDKNTLMAYLYDELDAPQKALVEAYLSEHPEVASELQDLNETRNILDNLPEEEPEIPTFEFPEETQVIQLPARKTSVWQSTFIRNTLTVAAMISFLLIVAALTNLRVSYQQGNFQLSFGESPKQPNPLPLIEQEYLSQTANQDSIQQLVEVEIEKNKRLLVNQLEGLSNKIKLLEKSPKIQTQTPQDFLDKDDVDKLIKEFQEENIETMLKLVSLAREDQQKYTDEIVSVFAEYLDRRREQDLQNIGKSLNNLQINQIKTQQETDRVIVKIIETVNLNNN